MSSLTKMVGLFNDLQCEWISTLLELGLCDSNGIEVSEEMLRHHLKFDVPVKKRGPKKGGNKASSKEGKDCCSAAKHQRTKGNYSKAKCGKPDCTRDDGHGNLLCDDCGARWDSVSSNSVGGLMCYAVGTAAKKGYGGAEWLGIYDRDVPPVFIGQSCCVVDDKGDWDMRASMDKISKGGDRRKGAFHTPLTAWKAPQQLEEDQTVVKEVVTEHREESESNQYEHNGVPYIKAEHDGETYLYRAYGEDVPDPMNADDATAQLKGDTVRWLDDDYENIHDDYVSNM